MPDKGDSVPSEPKAAHKVRAKRGTATTKKPSAAETAAAEAKNGVAHKTVKTRAKRVSAKDAPKEQPVSAVDRAEDTLEDFGKVVGGLLSSVGGKLRKIGAVAREEMEDFLAEAQSIRRGDTK